MIRPLRKRHLAWFAGLAVVLPALMIVALAARRPMPLGAWDGGPEPVAHLILERTERLGAVDVRVRLSGDSAPPARLVLELEPVEDLRQPDPLVYWSVGTGPIDVARLRGAVMLGRLAGTRARRFVLPPDAVQRDGVILVYSLPHQRLLGAFGLASGSFAR